MGNGQSKEEGIRLVTTSRSYEVRDRQLWLNQNIVLSTVNTFQCLDVKMEGKQKCK
jgi:hypothetical protein